MDSDADALSHFETMLAHAGYSPAHEADYDKLLLRIVEAGLFRVEDDFPRLTPLSFAAGVPPGVERVDYTIDLTVCRHLLIASSAAAADAALYY